MAEVVLKTIFKLKRGASTDWATKNPLLEAGEPGFELDTGKLKIGNGVARWNDLRYIGGGELSVDVDGLSIVIDNVGRISLAGFPQAQAGYSIRKSAAGNIEWYNPATKADITALEQRVMNAELSIGDRDSGLIGITNSLRQDATNMQTQISNVYTKTEVDSQIDTKIAEKLADASLTLVKVNDISEIDINAEDAEKHIYLVPKTAETDDVYDEYIVVDKKLEHIGTTKVSLDGYVKSEDFAPIKTKIDSAPTTILTGLGTPVSNETTIELVLNKSKIGANGAYEADTSEKVVIPSATSTTAGLLSKEDKVKLDKIDPDVQSTITGAKIAGTEATVEDKKIIIPVADANSAGVIKSSDAMSEVKVKEDGTAEIPKLGVDRLENVTDVTLVLCAGGAESV